MDETIKLNDAQSAEVKQLLSSQELKKPLDRANLGTDSLALRSLVNFVNNPEVSGAVMTAADKREIADTFKQPALDRRGATMISDPLPQLQTPSPSRELPTTSNSPPDTTTPAILGRKIFFTGRLCSGKDWCASAIGATIFGFADPMYALTEYLFGIKVNSNDGKNIAGVRKFLQLVGQWGRNEINEQYPLTAERAMFCLMVRSLANQKISFGLGIDWGRYGLTQDLWIDGLVNRINAHESEGRVATTNCRFVNEYKRLIAEGFEHWHVVCSPQTWISRLQLKGLKPDSSEVKDMSEKLASDLNTNLTKQLSAQRVGKKLRVVWNDPQVPPPSNRIYTLAEFTKLANQ